MSKEIIPTRTYSSAEELMSQFHKKTPKCPTLKRLSINPMTGEAEFEDEHGNIVSGTIEHINWDGLTKLTNRR